MRWGEWQFEGDYILPAIEFKRWHPSNVLSKRITLCASGAQLRVGDVAWWPVNFRTSGLLLILVSD